MGAAQLINSPRGFFWPTDLPARAVCVSNAVSISSVSEKRSEASTVKRNEAQKRRKPLGRLLSAATFFRFENEIQRYRRGLSFLPMEAVALGALNCRVLKVVVKL